MTHEFTNISTGQQTIITKDDIVNMINYYHLATGIVGNSRHAKLCYAAKHYSQENGLSKMACYKALDRELQHHIVY